MDWSALNAAISILTVLVGSIVAVATLRKVQHQTLTQALVELKALSEAQQQRLVGFQQQIAALQQELDLGTARIQQLQQDNLMLVRHNRQLEEQRDPHRHREPG